jgi:O-antigen ligase
MAAVAAAVLLVGALSWTLFPDVRTRISASPFDDRINAWTAAIYGIEQKPVLGWGYGKKIFHKDEPFENTPLKTSPHNKTEGTQYDDPHNVFLNILFQQGIIGFIPYVILLMLSIKTFWKEVLKKEGIAGYILLACVSVLAGNYIFHAMFSLIKLRYLAVVLGLGMAAMGMGSSRQDMKSKEG